MKKRRKFITAFTLATLIVTFVLPTSAMQKSFSVDFEDGTFGVLETEGNWTIVTEDNNKYAKCDDDIMDVPRLVIDRDVADFDIVFDVKQVNVNRSDANFGISARRSSDASNQYDIQYNGVDDFFEINRYYQGVKETLNMYQDEIKVTTGTWCTLGVKVKDNVISWYKDGKIVVSGTDSEELILSGDIKLFAYGVTICIDNIKYGPAGSINMETGEFYANEPQTTVPPETETGNPATSDDICGSLVLMVTVLTILIILVKRSNSFNI
jgi:hypothetical protein